MSEQILEQQQIKENSIRISGIAIKAGISRNRIKYTNEELMKFAGTLANKPILKDHNATVDNAVGLITESYTLNDGETVDYRGWVKEDGTNLLEKINDKRIKEVSIGAIAGRLVKESDDSDIMIAQDLHGLELSLTPVPGIIGTSLHQTLENIKQGKKAFVVESVKSFQKSEEEGIHKKILSRLLNFAKNDPIREAVLSEKYEVNKMDTKVIEQSFDACVKSKMDNGMSEKEAKNACAPSEFVDVIKQLKAKLQSYENTEKDRLITEYRSVAESRGIQAKDVSQMETSMLKFLIDELKSIKVNMTKTRIPITEGQIPINVTETSAYHNGKGLIFDDGIIIERPLDGGQGFAITCDPAKLTKEGARWRLFKNPSPRLYN